MDVCTIITLFIYCSQVQGLICCEVIYYLHVGYACALKLA